MVFERAGEKRNRQEEEQSADLTMDPSKRALPVPSGELSVDELRALRQKEFEEEKTNYYAPNYENLNHISSPIWKLRPRMQKLSEELQKELPIPVIESGKALAHTVWATCGRARAGCVSLPHGPVETPVFMPVGTQAAIKGLTTDDLKNLNLQIILNNTYHLANRPGRDVIHRNGGSHEMMRYYGNILTDSGGFQMVSLLQLAEIKEEGVEFEHPHTKEKMLLTPEKSIEEQNIIGSDIMMQLDDVVSSTCPSRERIEEATYRTFRWLDRCIEAHSRKSTQNLFGIVQGGLYNDLRRVSLKGMKERDLPGYAIGGLSGGECKDEFWRVVEVCTDPSVDESGDIVGLPINKPRYLMGVGYPIDIIVCVALGVDMFDCVFPCRTARFGTALTRYDGGFLRVKRHEYKSDTKSLMEGCQCQVCTKYSRAFLHCQMGKENTIGRLLTIHNLFFLESFMGEIRESILRGTFPSYLRAFLLDMFPLNKAKEFPFPLWVRDALLKAGLKDVIDSLPYDWDSLQ